MTILFFCVSGMVFGAMIAVLIYEFDDWRNQ